MVTKLQRARDAQLEADAAAAEADDTDEEEEDTLLGFNDHLKGGGIPRTSQAPAPPRGRQKRLRQRTRRAIQRA